MTASPNPRLREAAVLLQKTAKANDAEIWMKASQLLSTSSKNKVEVNIGRLSRIAKKGDLVFVPGKVLGYGNLEDGIIVGAYSFSTSARSKLKASGGSALSIGDFVNKYPKGSGVRLVE